MSAPEIEIALRPFKVGERSLEPGDKFEPEVARQLEEIHVTRLRRQAYVGELTRDTYHRVIGRRPRGTVGRGFTKAFLVEKGILDEAEADQGVEMPDGVIAHGPHFIRPRKSGHFTYYDVLNAKGELLRTTGFRSVDKAKAFLDGLSTDSGNSATPSEEHPEAGNDGDVQPGSE